MLFNFKQSTNSRLSLPNIRISPRKRLNLTDTPPSPQMYVIPPDIAGISPLAKKVNMNVESIYIILSLTVKLTLVPNFS